MAGISLGLLQENVQWLYSWHQSRIVTRKCSVAIWLASVSDCYKKMFSGYIAGISLGMATLQADTLPLGHTLPTARQFATFWWSAIIMLKQGKIYLVELIISKRMPVLF